MFSEASPVDVPTHSYLVSCPCLCCFIAIWTRARVLNDDFLHDHNSLFQKLLPFFKSSLGPDATANGALRQRFVSILIVRPGSSGLLSIPFERNHICQNIYIYIYRYVMPTYVDCPNRMWIVQRIRHVATIYQGQVIQCLLVSLLFLPYSIT